MTPSSDFLKQKISTTVTIRPHALKQLTALGITTVAEALLHFPSRYEDFSLVKNIIELQIGERASIKATVKQIKEVGGFHGFGARAEAVFSDDTSSIKVVWYNQGYIAEQLEKGEEIYLAGTPQQYKGLLQISNPLWEKVKKDTSEQTHTARIVPVYRLKNKMPQRTYRNILFGLLEIVQEIPHAILDIMPPEIVKRERLLTKMETLQALHFPTSQKDLDAAKQRMAYEEIFILQCAVQLRKAALRTIKSVVIPFDADMTSGFVNALPFEITPEQKKAGWDIFQDLQRQQPMNRLLEGDVSSGKTLVAFMTALSVLANGKQVALICPTGILAEQHYQSALKYFAEYTGFSLILLTAAKHLMNGDITPKTRIAEEIAHGGPQFVIGTHAALQKSIEFGNLAYVIIDEQHRFGVRQRAELQRRPGSKVPHLLSMTATPIPRTLQLALFGDLDVSLITKKPQGRLPVSTKVVPQEDRARAYDSVAKQIAAGRQAFVVVPLINEQDEDDDTSNETPKREARSAITEARRLKKVFPDCAVGLLHGKMKATEQEQVMRDFLDKKIDILVSTTVIEVGVDVPNASVMIIENAERFGLAQLHQLRGRVGRGDHQSYCLLFSGTQNPESLVRLRHLETTNDGFKLAELDLQTRGGGNVFGTEQSGIAQFDYYDIADTDSGTRAQRQAQELLQRDAKLTKHPLLRTHVKKLLIHFE
jgi:ATP-dependent DNA helicase RecG